MRKKADSYRLLMEKTRDELDRIHTNIAKARADVLEKEQRIAYLELVAGEHAHKEGGTISAAALNNRQAFLDSLFSGIGSIRESIGRLERNIAALSDDERGLVMEEHRFRTLLENEMHRMGEAIRRKEKKDEDETSSNFSARHRNNDS